MFIVHVVRQFDPAIGGIEAVVRELAAAQVAAGHRVRVVTLNRLFKAAHSNTLHRARADQWRGGYSGAVFWVAQVSISAFGA
jgi:hypothetical protein